MLRLLACVTCVVAVTDDSRDLTATAEADPDGGSAPAVLTSSESDPGSVTAFSSFALPHVEHSALPSPDEVAAYQTLRKDFDWAFERFLSATPVGEFANSTLLFDGKHASVYINRELSWLSFNRRVLAEAESTRHPLLERLRFLSISFSNLDEFFMVRIAGLTQLVKTLVEGLSADGLTPSAQLAQTLEAANELIAHQQRVWSSLQDELRISNSAQLISCKNLSVADREYLHTVFLDELWPQLTPQSIDNAHPFPFVPNKGMGIALTMLKRKRSPNPDATRRTRPRRARKSGEDSFLEDEGASLEFGGTHEKRISLSSTGAEHVYEMEATHAAIPDELRALLLLPPQLRRFIKLPFRNTSRFDVPRFVLVEDMLTTIELDGFFPERELRERGMFRVLRDSEVEVDEEAVDLVRMFETALKRRRKGVAIRLDVDARMPSSMREWLASAMGLSLSRLIVIDGLVGLGDVSQIISETAAAAVDAGKPPLVYQPFSGRIPERVTRNLPERSKADTQHGGIFAAIREKDIIVHHPFESFETVLLFVRAAAADPSVVAIKQTLYRTSENSPIVSALIEAAESGKTVTALIELKARFDEEANIRWAKDLERAGVQVVYGFRELKTHAKIALVVRKEVTGLQSYVHMSTGNYHPQTAKVYTDLSLFTANPALARDATRLFNFCSGYSIASLKDLEHLEVAPVTLRRALEEHIVRCFVSESSWRLGLNCLTPPSPIPPLPSILQVNEIENARDGLPAHIVVKVNALVDTSLIDLLYEASEAGVNITLIVRGMCSLRPGIPGLSSRIVVKSIVGRFLEHSRIVAFANGHPIPSPENLVFISSADWMPRNLDWRVEALIPILNPTVHRQVLDEVLVHNMREYERRTSNQSHPTQQQ